MIPRNLPSLAAAAIRNEWDIDVEQSTYYRSVACVRAYFYRGDTSVTATWERETGRLVTSEINNAPTPYAQCARLIRSTTEGTPS